MAKNFRGPAGRVVVTAAANRTSGEFVVEQGFHGTVTTTTASGSKYALDIEQREIEIAELSGAAVGQLVYITGANALTLTVGSNRLVGKITKLAGTDSVPTGKQRMLVLHQTA